MRTEQELFDVIVAHLRQQQARSMDPGGSYCAYRGAAGMKCAVGVLIPDEVYSLEMEANSLPRLIRMNVLPGVLVEEFTAHSTILTQLQNVHDQISIHNWELHFQSIADAYQLNFISKS